MRSKGALWPALLGGGAFIALASWFSRKASAHPVSVGASSNEEEDLKADYYLKTFRGKLIALKQLDPTPSRVAQLYLFISDQLPRFSGDLGGSDQNLTLENFGHVQWALFHRGGEGVIPVEPRPKSKDNDRHEAFSKENVDQILARVKRARMRILTRLYGHPPTQEDQEE